MKKRLWIVDDFYNNPNDVRKFALETDYSEDDNYYKGLRSAEQHVFPGTQEMFEEIMGMKLKQLSHHGMSGRFQICRAEERKVYHVDTQQWAAMVYLTPNAPVGSGTCLLRSKKTGARHVNDEAFEGSFDGGFYDKTKFEVVDQIGNVFNRLIIMDSQCIHAACEYFGQGKEDSRLTHLFFIDSK